MIRRVLSNGFSAVAQRNSAAPFAQIRGWVPAGDFNPSSSRIIPFLAHKMLLRGTKQRTREEFEDNLAAHALELQIANSAISGFHIEWSGWALPEYVCNLVALAAEMFISPRFDEAEFEIVKQEQKTELEIFNLDPTTQAERAGLRMLFPAEHPLYRCPIDEHIEEIANADMHDLRRFWEASSRQAGNGIAVVGDMEEDAVLESIEDSFAVWRLKSKSRRIAPAVPFQKTQREEQVIFIPEKESATLWLGKALPITVSHSDYPALLIAVNALGGQGLHTRLFQTMREERGLTYGVYAKLRHTGVIPGYLGISATVNPQNIQAAQEVAFATLQTFFARGIEQSELDAEKILYRSHYAFQHASFAGIAKTLAQDAILGIPNFTALLVQQVQHLKLEEVNAVIQKYLDPSNLAVVRAGTVS